MLGAGTDRLSQFEITLDGNKFKWSADVSKFITLKDGKFVVKAITEDDKPKNGVDSYTSYVFNFDNFVFFHSTQKCGIIPTL